MLPDEIRSRLEQLNRRPLPAPCVGRPTEPLASLAESSQFSRPCGTRQSFGVRFPTGEEQENASGKHWRLRQPLAQFWPDADARIPCTRPMTEWSLAPSALAHPELAAFADSFPRGALFLDLETCGFAGSMVFLIGLIRSTGEGLVLEQLFARNYAEERAILQTLWEIAGQNQVLVTFNGKSFDWPMINDRSVLHRLDCGTTPEGETERASAAGLASGEGLPRLVHCDLLHHARRKWKGLLPNCKLQTLERFVCRRYRGEDIGGAHIPAAYHEFVRSGNWEPLQSVLHHNALDLVTLVEVVLSLVERGPSPPAPL